MQKKRFAVTIVFIGLLIGPAVYLRWSHSESPPWGPSETDRRDLWERYGFVLEEVSQESGIAFVHREPGIDDRLQHIGPQIAAMGASVSVVDFDRDGWQDFFVTNSAPGSQNALYRNLRNGNFENVAESVRLTAANDVASGTCMGSVWADYDNDGFEDVLIFKWGRAELFRNESGQEFRRVTDLAAVLPDWANVGCATWLDYDRDGFVDLFLAGYWPDDINLQELAHTRIMPESFEYANNGGRKWLLRNRGDGSFADVTARAGIESQRWTLAVVAADFNNDNFPDLFLANDYGVSELYVNDAGKSFQEVGKSAGIGTTPKSGMNAAVGDVLNQGRLAIYETNISEQGVLIQGNNLWIPSDATGLEFDNLAAVMGVELGGWSFGAQFGDLNNDGFVDLYLTNGYVSGEQGTSYWYDFSQITGGHRQIISDARNWPAMKNRSLAGYQAKHVWLNDGAGRFLDVARSVGVTDRYDGRAVALVDLTNRGVLDVLVANQRGPLLVYRNDVAPGRHWIQFELEGGPSNRSAIGAQVRIEWNGQHQLQELVAASGYAAQNQRRLHFGLGQHDSVDRVHIRWPSGREQVIESPSIDQLHHVRELP